MPTPALTLPRSSPTLAAPRSSIVLLPALIPKAPGRFPPTDGPLVGFVALLVGGPADVLAGPAVAPPATDPTPLTVALARLEMLCASAPASNIKHANTIPSVNLFICCPTKTCKVRQPISASRWVEKEAFDQIVRSKFSKVTKLPHDKEPRWSFCCPRRQPTSSSSVPHKRPGPRTKSRSVQPGYTTRTRSSAP
jgi:hypothetical protein